MRGKGGGGSGSEVRAGGSYYELFMRESVTKSLAKIQARVQGFGEMLKRTGTTAFAGGAGILGGIGGVLKSAGERTVELDKLAKKLGVPIEKINGLAYAAEVAGVDLDGLSGDFENFAERVAQGAAGTGEAAEAFKKLGIDAKALSLKDPVDQLLDVLAAIDQVENRTEQLGLLSAFGGDQFQWLAELKDFGPEGIRAAMADASPVTANDAKNAREFSRAMLDMTRSLQSGVLPLLQYVTPLMKQFGDFASRNAHLMTAIAVGGAALVAVGAGFLALSLTVSGLGAAYTLFVTGPAALLSGAIGALTGALGFLKLSFAAVTSPLWLTIGAAVGISVAFLHATGALQGLWDMAKDAFGSIAATATSAWQGISDAMKAGDLSLAWRVALAGVMVEWSKFEMYLVAGWNVIKDVFVDGWLHVKAGVRLVWNDMAAALQTTFLTVIETILEAFGDGVRAMLTSAAVVAGVFDDALAKRIEATAGDLAPGNVRAAKADIEKERRENAGKIAADLAAELKERAKARHADLWAAAEKLSKAKEELQLAKEAAAEAAKPKLPPEAEKPPGGGGAPSWAESVRVAIGAGLGDRQFGIGSKVEMQQLDFAKRAARAAENGFPAVVGAVENLTRALAFK